MRIPRSERLIQIVEFVNAQREPVSVDVLARRFGISRRTLFKDISALRARGIEINGAPARGGGLTLVDSLPTAITRSVPLWNQQNDTFVGREREMAGLTAALCGTGPKDHTTWR